jgi:hypothetical protein
MRVFLHAQNSISELKTEALRCGTKFAFTSNITETKLATPYIAATGQHTGRRTILAISDTQ